MPVTDRIPSRLPYLDAVGLPWLVSVRWAGVLAQAGAVAVGVQGLAAPGTLTPQIAVIGASSLSNLWLGWRQSRRQPLPLSTGGWLVCADIAVLSWLLHHAGGVLNPAAIFYLVYIVLAGLVLDRTWAWIVTTLSVSGYGLLYLTPHAELAAAGSMHPEIGLHVRGMWMAFAASALLVAVLVSRLASLIERRDRMLAELRERAARDARLASLATLAAGAAHELSTPLGTIAVAAREIELALARSRVDGELLDDAQLIRSEVDRCRRVLHDMSARLSEPIGVAAERQTAASIVDAALTQLSPDERSRVRASLDDAGTVTWPSGVVGRAIVNVLRNALQASPPMAPIEIRTALAPDGQVAMTVTDRGSGMPPEVLARAGEPFYTTKAQGEGTGLGLFVARSTMEQLGGGLVVTSRVNEGTVVTMTLPSDVSRP